MLELERALAHEKSQNSSAVVEAKELRIRVEDLRRRINDLEASNQTLGHRASELQINMQDQAAAYESKVENMFISISILNFFRLLEKTKKLLSSNRKY